MTLERKSIHVFLDTRTYQMLHILKILEENTITDIITRLIRQEYFKRTKELKEGIKE